MNKKHLNIYGEAYAEDKEAYATAYTVTVYDDEEDDEMTVYMVHQMVCLGDRRFSETLLALDVDVFDGGVLAFDTESYGYGWDNGDLDGEIRQLAVSCYLQGEEVTHERYWKLLGDVEYEECNAGYTLGVAFHYYDKTKSVA